MNSNPRVFLDTSIQIERLIGPGSHKVAIERQFAMPNFGAMTSHYDLSAHPRCIKDQGHVGRLLGEVLLDPHVGLGQSACWPLGDIIIALQLPADTRLWTRDPDFVPLAAVLGIPLYSPPNVEA